MISTIELERPGTKTLPPTYQSGLNGWTINALPVMKYPLYGRITIASVQFVLARFYQNVGKIVHERYQAG